MNETVSNENKNKDQSVVAGLTDIIRDAQRLFDLEQLQEKLLETQHQNNLEIFKKQEKSATRSLIISVVATILASLLGTGLGWYLSNLKTQPQSPIQSEPTSAPQQNVQSKADVGKQSPQKTISESPAQVAVVLKNVSSVPHSKPQKGRK